MIQFVQLVGLIQTDRFVEIVFFQYIPYFFLIIGLEEKQEWNRSLGNGVGVLNQFFPSVQLEFATGTSYGIHENQHLVGGFWQGEVYRIGCKPCKDHVFRKSYLFSLPFGY